MTSNNSVTSGSTEFLNFSEALNHLRWGERVSRRGWNEKNQFIKLQYPDEHSKMRHPYIYIAPVNRVLVPWTPTQTDLLAEDWYVLSEVN